MSQVAGFQPVTPRAASTLVLMRDGAQGAPEVLMVERSGDANFAAGAYVFPGGQLDAADSAPLAVQLSPGLSPTQAARVLVGATSDAEALGSHVAAIRETFEESGILLARPGAGAANLGAAALAAARAEMNRGGLGFLDALASWHWVLSTERLVYFAHWVTPEAVPKRFDTRFFLAAAPDGMQAAHDAQEVVSHRWITPAEALEAAASKRIHMIEPTVKNLELLADFGSTDAALNGLSGKPVTRIMPKLVMNPQGKRVIVFPWQPEYETA
jgi:8-oxo-dGTP pyrophosphatase MutT (NUDIX family)